MNIFNLSNDPVECASWHNDRHTVKMIVEYAQLLSTAHRILDGQMATLIFALNGVKRKKKLWVLDDEQKNRTLYQATHINHPSAIWARQSKQNYEWLYQLWIALIDEWRARYNHSKIHKSEILKELLATPPSNILDVGKTPVALAMPDHYKISDDPVICYREYYKLGKAHLASWKGKNAPPWFYKFETLV